ILAHVILSAHVEVVYHKPVVKQPGSGLRAANSVTSRHENDGRSTIVESLNDISNVVNQFILAHSGPVVGAPITHTSKCTVNVHDDSLRCHLTSFVRLPHGLVADELRDGGQTALLDVSVVERANNGLRHEASTVVATVLIASQSLVQRDVEVLELNLRTAISSNYHPVTHVGGPKV